MSVDVKQRLEHIKSIIKQAPVEIRKVAHGPAPECNGGSKAWLSYSPGGPSCYCGGRRYTCPGCLRFIPECLGADDVLAEYCDDCANAIVKYASPDGGWPTLDTLDD